MQTYKERVKGVPILYGPLVQRCARAACHTRDKELERVGCARGRGRLVKYAMTFLSSCPGVAVSSGQCCFQMQQRDDVDTS